jgi:hypothetical protein
MGIMITDFNPAWTAHFEGPNTTGAKQNVIVLGIVLGNMTMNNVGPYARVQGKFIFVLNEKNVWKPL